MTFGKFIPITFTAPPILCSQRKWSSAFRLFILNRTQYFKIIAESLSLSSTIQHNILIDFVFVIFLPRNGRLHFEYKAISQFLTINNCLSYIKCCHHPFGLNFNRNFSISAENKCEFLRSQWFIWNNPLRHSINLCAHSEKKYIGLLSSHPKYAKYLFRSHMSIF